MSNFIRIFDVDDKETLLNLNAVTNITKVDDEQAAILFNSGNFMMISIDTYTNISLYLGLKS